MGRFAVRRNAAARRHHGDRGRRRRAGGDRDGDRARRALRPGADPSVARARRARAANARPASCSTARRSARPPRRASRSCARPRTASASPRRICGCAAKATCSARASPACRASGSRASRRTAPLLEPARKDAQLILSRDPDAHLGARRGAAASALSVRARRGDPAAAGWLTFVCTTNTYSQADPDGFAVRRASIADSGRIHRQVPQTWRLSLAGYRGAAVAAG